MWYRDRYRQSLAAAKGIHAHSQTFRTNRNIFRVAPMFAALQVLTVILLRPLWLFGVAPYDFDSGKLKGHREG
jgi:hypothetical protein